MPEYDAKYVVQPPNNLSESQRKIVEDGVVTKSEYRQAVTDWAACVTARGFESGFVEEDEWGRISFGFEYSTKGMAAQQIEEQDRNRTNAYSDCGDTHAVFVEGY